jgi:hypothetical protein
MSFASAIAGKCADDATKVILFQLVVALAIGAGAAWLIKSLGCSGHHITRDDIDMLKDAATAIGPGDPIARELWRLAERAEGK